MSDQRTSILLSAADLDIGYAAAAPVAQRIAIEVVPGEVVCLLGPNGSGKSTLLKTLAGMLAPLSGGVMLEHIQLSELSPNERARRLSTVLATGLLPGNMDVRTLVELGRSPHTGPLGRLRDADKKAVDEAINATDLALLANRRVATLSDGERQKVMIARALAQQAPLMLLDEPTAHLDLPNRVATMRLLRRLARETGTAIVLSTHELDLALKAADRLWLLDRDGHFSKGVPEDMVLSGRFESAFSNPDFDFDRSSGSFRLHEDPACGPVQLKGHAVGCFWTRRALHRQGIAVSEDAEIRISVTAGAGEGDFKWSVQHHHTVQEAASVDTLMTILAILLPDA